MNRRNIVLWGAIRNGVLGGVAGFAFGRFTHILPPPVYFAVLIGAALATARYCYLGLQEVHKEREELRTLVRGLEEARETVRRFERHSEN